MSTEIFCTKPLSGKTFIGQPLEGFEWKSEASPPINTRVLVHTATGKSVLVYVGNGRYVEPRGYRDDAVWFEAFAWSDAVPELFDRLGDLLDCTFVTEVGEEVSAERPDNWDDDLVAAALHAIQKTPGSTSRYFKKPRDLSGYEPCNPAEAFK